MNLEKQKFTKYNFFPGFELKFQVFQFSSKFQAFSRPGKVNDRIPGFPGSLGTLTMLLTMHSFHFTKWG